MTFTAAESDAGDERLASFCGRRGWQFGILGALFTILAAGGGLIAQVTEIAQTGQIPEKIDFRVFWGAGRLAVEGTPLEAFDLSMLSGVAGLSGDFYLPWLYPPGMLMLVTPLGLMSYSVAWIVFSLASLAFFGFALRPFVSGIVPVWMGFALSPAFLPALYVGQHTLFWLGTLLFALHALRSGRLILAGVLIGLLTLKPQLGLLIPFALLAAGVWRTILAACLTTVAAALGPTLLYGTDYWPLMLRAMRIQSEVVFSTVSDLGLMASPFALFAGLGLSIETAMTLQWMLAAVGAGFVFWVWRSRTSFDLKCATLLAATSICLPYSWFYEAAMLSLVALFLFRAGALRPRMPDLALFVLLWIGGAPIIVARLVGNTSEVSARFVLVPVAALAVAVCVAHFAKDRRTLPRSIIRP